MHLSKNSNSLNKRIENQIANLEMIGKFGKLNKKRLDISGICLFDHL